MPSKRISDLLNSKPHKLRIKDYAKVEYVFNLYLDQKYDTMAREIYWYKAFDFFKDLAIYLQSKFNIELFRKFYYSDMWELFEERIDAIWYENDLKKASKKYGL